MSSWSTEEAGIPSVVEPVLEIQLKIHRHGGPLGPVHRSVDRDRSFAVTALSVVVETITADLTRVSFSNGASTAGGGANLNLHLLFSTEKRRNPLIYSWIESYPSNFLKTVAVASRPPFFEPKARGKEYGGLEATATPAEVSFSNDPASVAGAGLTCNVRFNFPGGVL